MKLDSFKCDRCGKTFDYSQSLQGTSHGVVEKEWDICDDCLVLFYKFIGELKDG